MFSSPDRFEADTDTDTQNFNSGEIVALKTVPASISVPDSTSSGTFVTTSTSSDGTGQIDVSDINSYANLTNTLRFELVGRVDPNGAAGGADVKLRNVTDGEDATMVVTETGTGFRQFSTGRNSYSPTTDFAEYEVFLRSFDGATSVTFSGVPFVTIWGEIA